MDPEFEAPLWRVSYTCSQKGELEEKTLNLFRALFSFPHWSCFGASTEPFDRKARHSSQMLMVFMAHDDSGETAETLKRLLCHNSNRIEERYYVAIYSGMEDKDFSDPLCIVIVAHTISLLAIKDVPKKIFTNNEFSERSYFELM